MTATPDLYHLAADMHARARALRQEADQLDVDADALHALVMASATEVPTATLTCGRCGKTGHVAQRDSIEPDMPAGRNCNIAEHNIKSELSPPRLTREVKWIDAGSMALGEAAVMLGNLIGGTEPRMHCNLDDYTKAGLQGVRSRILLAHGHGWLIPRTDIPAGRVVSG